MGKAEIQRCSDELDGTEVQLIDHVKYVNSSEIINMYKLSKEEEKNGMYAGVFNRICIKSL